MFENTNTANRQMGSILITLGIHPGEEIAVGLLFGQSFSLGIAFFALYTAGTAIFLSHFEASVMAYVYVVSAVLLILVGVFFNRLEQQISFSLLLLGSTGGLILTLLLLRIGLWAASSSWWASWVAFLLIVALRLCWTLMNLVIWALAGRLFNVRQSKRLFPLIIVGTVLAIIISGLINQQLIDLMGIPNLLWISVGGLVGAAGLLFITLRIFHESVGSPHATGQVTGPISGSTTSSGTSKSTLTQTWLSLLAPYRDRYILWMMAFMALSTLASYLLEFIFIREANTHYQDTAAYASFFGTYLGVTTLILLVVSLISGAILERLGLRIGLQANGAAVAIFALIFLISSLLFGAWSLLFWLVVLTKLSDDVLIVAMTNTAQRILYQPIPAARRVAVQTLIEGIVSPLVLGFVGLFLIALQFVGDLTTRQLFLILVIICLGWTFAGVRVHDAYRGALRKALLKRRFAAIEPDQIAAEREQVLREGLRSEHPGVVLYSLNILIAGDSGEEDSLENEAGKTVRELLPELLSHEAMEVRLDVAQRMEKMAWLKQLGDSSVSESWLTLLQERLAAEPCNQVSAALCRALIALAEASGDQDALVEASALLFNSASELQNATLVGLLRHGGIQSILTAGPKLLELTYSAVKEDRVLAAQLVGQVGESKFYEPLLPLLTDDENAVRNAAIQASAEVNNAALWPLVARGLTDASTRKNAARALAQGGKAVLPTVSALFTAPDQSRYVQTALVRIVGQIGGSEADNPLWEWATQADNAKVVQGEIWRGLRYSGYIANAEQKEVVLSQIEYELAQVSWLGSAWEIVNQAATKAVHKPTQDSLLAAALVNELGQARSNLFELLTFICDRSLIMQVRRILERRPFSLPDDAAHQHQHQPSADEQSAYAQEILDDLLPPEFKQWLLPILSTELDHRTRQAMQVVYPAPTVTYTQWLLTLMKAPDSQIITWTKACAIYAAKKSLSPESTARDKSAIEGAEKPLFLPQQHEFALIDAIKMHQQSQDSLIQETANLVAQQYVGGWEKMNKYKEITIILSTIEKVLHLKSVSIFAQVPDHLLANVAGMLETVEFPLNAPIFQKGDPGDAMYVIVSGSVRIEDDGYVVATQNEGTVFGEMALLDGEPRSASAVSADETLLLQLLKEEFQELLEDHGEIALGIIRVLSERLRARTQDLSERHESI